MFKLKWSHLEREIKDSELLSDQDEKSLRIQLIDNIIDSVNEYNSHILNYEYEQKQQEIRKRGVVFVPMTRPSTVKANWSRLFAATLSSQEKKSIYYEYHKWHIFSYEKEAALTKSKARQAFNRCKKGKVYLFYQHKEEAFLVENSHLLKSSDFDMDSDVYLFDPINRWTYVHTHEAQCGPYFYKIK